MEGHTLKDINSQTDRILIILLEIEEKLSDFQESKFLSFFRILKPIEKSYVTDSPWVANPIPLQLFACPPCIS